MLLASAVVTGSFLFSNRFAQPARTNIILQLIWFAISVNIPALKTGRMSYVDIGWPWGLAVIGLLPLLHGESNACFSWSLSQVFNRANLVTVAYLVAGVRMGLGGIILLQRGHLNKELPRYLFQRRRWAKRGILEDQNSFWYKLEMQKEIFVQCLGNTGTLSTPILLQGFGYINPEIRLTSVEIFGWMLWVASLIFEHVADMQKLRFAVKCKKDGVENGVCDVGLWKYCRHPNYFGEWMVWNSLVLTSLPSLHAMWSVSDELLVVKLMVSASLIMVSYGMYICLVYYTGAVPAEYYSLRKRPLYAEYQKSVNMFFPGPSKI